MVRQYRIEHIQGMEFLVCEVYDRYFWNQGEYEAWKLWRDEMDASQDMEHKTIYSYDEFRVLLNEWCELDHDEQDTFYGLREPIPAISSIPCVILRGLIVDQRMRSFSIETTSAMTELALEDEFSRFVRFIRNPHWRNTVSHNIERYGTLFTSPDDH